MRGSTRRRASGWLVGLVLGVAYGMVARVLVHSSGSNSALLVMTFSFLFLVPLVVGYLSVRFLEDPGWLRTLVWPWAPACAAVAVTWLIGWEGAICIVMGLPIVLVMASVGGGLARLAAARQRARMAALLLVPLFGIPAESRLPNGSPQLREVRSSVTIMAPPSAIWREIASVPTILEREHRPALYTTIGFPRPVSATISYEGAGAVRHARFEGGILFIETVTEWQPDRRLAFTIAAQTDSIPPSTLDPHVTIGGPFFDVLTGTYLIEPAAPGASRLTLVSTHRLSTRFNLYAGLWTDAIMRSIQRNILHIIAERVRHSRANALTNAQTSSAAFTTEVGGPMMASRRREPESPGQP